MTKIILINIFKEAVSSVKSKTNNILCVYVLNVSNGYEFDKYKI